MDMYRRRTYLCIMILPSPPRVYQNIALYYENYDRDLLRGAISHTNEFNVQSSYRLFVLIPTYTHIIK
jgi:hypothetical protein